MRTLIYKRTHEGDPHPYTRIFGNNDCMGRVRGWDFEAVIGVGGKTTWPGDEGLARKLTWVGLGAWTRQTGQRRGPLVMFKNFVYEGKDGPLLEDIAPALATLFYDKNPYLRAVISSSLSAEEQSDVEAILKRARATNSSPSRGGQSFRPTTTKCRPNASCR
jgi:hypothetical protein